MILTIPQLQAHIRDDVTGDDLDLLVMFARAAFTHVNDVTGQAYDMTGPDFPDVPDPVAASVLLIVGDLWEHREAQLDMATYENKTVDRLLSPYRVWS